MNKRFSLLDMVLANQAGQTISSELRNLVLQYGSLERNLLRHIDLVNDVPKYYQASIKKLKVTSQTFTLLLDKIQEIEARIEKYMSLMLDAGIELPDLATKYVRLQNLIKNIPNKTDSNPQSKENIELKRKIEFLNKEMEEDKNLLKVYTNKIKTLKKKINYKLGNLSNEEIEKLADECRKKNGKLNYTEMGRRLGRDPKTVKSEIERRNLSYLKNSP